MLTKTLYIKHCSDFDLLDAYQAEYTKLFYKLYNNAELMVDDHFIDSCLNDFIDRSIYDSCLSQVKTKLKQHETNTKNKLKEIDQINKILSKNDFKSKKEKKHKYNLINKFFRLKRNINKNIAFGGKTLLRTINKQYVQIKSLFKELDKEKDLNKIKEIEQAIKDKIELLQNNKSNFKEKRKLGFSFIGRANEKGNRKFSFDLNNNTIIFKPNKDTKIEIKFSYKDKKTKLLLSKLQYLSENREIPLTVNIKGKSINISYDNELLHGFSFNEKECKKEQQNATNKEEKKEIYIKHKREQERNKKLGKIENRYLAVDLNPNFIGLSIFESKDDKVGKIFHKELIDLTKLNVKLGKSSNDFKQLKQNNKRRFEITQVWKYIFGLAKHYKVYNFVMEDLNFQPNNKESKAVSFNRLTKNLWNRGFIEQMINKYCQNIGLNKVDVNPVYSSFIGNMVYNYADPISASLEIGRRCIVKYKKGGSIYPDLSSINQEKLSYLLGENVDIERKSWQQIYANISLMRYRNPIDVGLKAKNLYSHKSNVCVY